MTVLEQLKEFLVISGSRLTANRWLFDDKMRVYVRKGRRRLDGKELKTTLDIATVDVYEQSQGTFRNFLAEAHELNPWDATYAECVVNPRLAMFFVNKGWVPVNGGESFYFLKEKSL